MSCPAAGTTVKTLFAAAALAFLSGPAAAGQPGRNLDIPGLIDIHAHIGSYAGYDLSLDNLLRNMAENHVRCAFVSNVDGAAVPNVTADEDETAVNEETARVCRLHPQLKPLAWAKPGAKGADARKIEPFLRDRGFIGIKFHPEFNFFPADAETVVPYLRLCERYKVPALFHCGLPGSNSSARRIYAQARRFPSVPFILYHMGFGSDHAEAIAAAAEAERKGDARLYLETAQCDADSVLRAVRTVGADHVLFGSDATYYGRDHYLHYSAMLETLRKDLSPKEFALVTHGNAERLFRLKP